VDPTVLIEALRLDKGDQQDAGEFCKLFLDLISAELSKQKDPQLETIINDLVRQYASS
jgi:ubiquitin carboxyl-terminal hydrolase 48